MSFTTKIKEVESEFDGIYRITCENGLILDIPEDKKPLIGSRFEYKINATNDPIYFTTMMNGIIFDVSDTNILVSFGGLLGNIPLIEASLGNISLSYKIE